MTATKPPAGYLRLSLRTDTSDLGLDRQKELITQQAANLGLPEPVWYADTASAYKRNSKRPRFDAMVEAVRAGQHDYILVTSIERLYRRLGDLVWITDLVQNTGVKIKTIYSGDVDLESADGLAIARIMGTLAERESAKTAERVHLQVKHSAAAGRPTVTHVQFGWMRDPNDPRRLVPDPTTAPLVRLVYQMIDQGESLNDAAKAMEAAGVPTPTGNVNWHHATIQKIVKSPRHAGWATHKGKVVADLEGGGLVDRALWLRVQERLSDPARKSPGGSLTLLSGLLECGRPGCGARPRGGKKHGRAIYRCPRCGVSVARGKADAYMLDEAAAVLGEHVESIREAMAADPTGPSTLAIQRQRESLTALAAMLRDEQIGPLAYAAAASGIEAEIARLEAKMSTPPPKALIGLASQRDPVRAFRSLNLLDKRDVLDALGGTVVLLPRGELDLRWA